MTSFAEELVGEKAFLVFGTIGTQLTAACRTVEVAQCVALGGKCEQCCCVFSASTTVTDYAGVRSIVSTA